MVIRLLKLLVVAAVLLWPNTGAFAQNYFGHFNFGPVLGNYSRLQRDLQQSHLLGPDFVLPQQGIQVGGSGMVYLKNGLLMGGSGFAGFYGTGTGSRAEGSVSVAAGFFNLGYALHHQNGILLYPYVGFGGQSTGLEITNTGNTPFSFSAHHALQPGQTHEYSASGLALEGGIALKKLLPVAGGTGYVLGLEAGTFGLPALQSWETDDQGKATALTSTHSQGFYVRLTFGGGRF